MFNTGATRRQQIEIVSKEIKEKGLSDIDVASRFDYYPIMDIAGLMGIDADSIEPYGKYKAKINSEMQPKGRLVLVTAINPTPAGEGKTTVSIGLADAMNILGLKTCLALREPSLGPVFGVKGGATGGGLSQVVPMEDINLHFTGDIHAITTANNLLSAVIDNHLQQGNSLRINPKRITWNRAMDLNDRVLRNIVVGAGGVSDGVTRMDKFNITAASEIMAIVCLATSLENLKERLGNICIGYTYDNTPVYARELNVHNAMAILLKEAIKPNLVQTLLGTPTFIHGGPFANIAHGCNSVIATKTALTYADYVVTEAGFGADLGAEKFLDLKCRVADLSPSCAVVVATVRALKSHGGVPKAELSLPNVQAVKTGCANLGKHLSNMASFNLPAVVALNLFTSDTNDEIEAVKEYCESLNVHCVPVKVWAEGGLGAIELAKKVKELADAPLPQIKYTYQAEDSIEEKIEKLAKNIYGAGKVVFTTKATNALKKIKAMGVERLPVIVAKTQYSLSDDPKLINVPKDFTFTVSDLEIRTGSGFIVAISGDVMLMPGLPKKPASEGMTISADGTISGLF